MKIAMYSDKKRTLEGLGWFRGGFDIRYEESVYRKAHVFVSPFA